MTGGDVWLNLRAKLLDAQAINQDRFERQVTCIEMPEVLHSPFFFTPDFVLFFKKKGSAPYVGVWTFRGARQVIQYGCQMDPYQAHEIFVKLSPVVARARQGKGYVFAPGPVEASVLKAPQLSFPGEGIH